MIDSRVVVPLVYMLAILTLSSVPGSASSEHAIHLGWLPSLLQNALHVPLYGLLVLLWIWATRDYTTHRRAKTAGITFLCISFAIVDELYQATVPGRYGSVSDVGLDTLGVCLSVWLAHRFPNSIPFLSTFPKSPEPATIQR